MTEVFYEVSVRGFDEAHVLRAASRSQARYRSWRAANEAGYYTKRHGGFMAFSRDSRVILSPDQGDPRTPEFGVAY